MPTKDELTAENATLRERVKELEAAASPGLFDAGGEPLVLNALYKNTEDGLAKLGPGLYGFDGNDVTPYELEDGEVYMVDVEQEPEFFKVELDEDKSYQFTVGIGFHDTAQMQKGVYVMGDDAFGLRRLPTGKYIVTQEDETAEVAGAPMEEDTPVGAMAEEVEKLRADVRRLEVERDEARGQARAAQERLQNSQTLHGHVDNLKAPY